MTLPNLPLANRWHQLDFGRRAVAIVVAGLLALLALGTALTLRQEHRHAIDGVLARDAQTALRLAAVTSETLDAIEQALRLVVYLHGKDGTTRLHALADTELIATRTTHSISITDAAGQIVDSTSADGVPLNIADEDDFKRVRASAGEGLSIGTPQQNALTALWSVPVWRRIVLADGSFGGVAVAHVDPAALIGSGIRADSDTSVVSIVGSDGVIRARLAGESVLTAGAKVDIESVRLRSFAMRQDRTAMRSPVDGRERFLSSVGLERYPLFAVVGTDAETALPAYAAGRSLTLRWSAMVAVLVVAGGWLLVTMIGRLETGRRTHLHMLRDFRAAIEGSMDAVAILACVEDASGRIVDMTVTDVNSRAAEMVSRSREELIGQPMSRVMPMIESEGLLRTVAVARRDQRAISGEIPSTDPRLIGRWMHHQVVPLAHGAALIIRDVTESKEQQRQLDSLARFDSLTGLPNRRHFEESLTQARARALRGAQPLALLYIDLDGFKAVNDTLGHEGGDMLLQGVSLRLLESVRATDLVARLGGDEFAVILEAAGSEEHIREICERVLEALSLEHRIDGHPVVATPSIGAVLLFGDEGEESLRRRADEAMYDAKRAGKSRYRFVTEPVAPEESVTV